MDIDKNTDTTELIQPVNLTEAAVSELKRLLDKEDRDNLFLRIGVDSGGCSGMSYKMAFDDKPAEIDQQFDFDGLAIRIDPNALMYLNGIVIDYKGGLLGGGFHFSNPNAKRSCGCGTSFTC